MITRTAMKPPSPMLLSLSSSSSSPVDPDCDTSAVARASATAFLAFDSALTDASSAFLRAAHPVLEASCLHPAFAYSALLAPAVFLAASSAVTRAGLIVPPAGAGQLLGLFSGSR